MAWKYNDRIIRVGRAWTTDDGITHPSNWAIWSDEDKVAAGLVWEEPPASFDNRFYWSAGVPKALEDVQETWSQEEIDRGDAPEGTQSGDNKLDFKGNPIITRGLKYQAIQTCKQQAAGLLASTDWYITRNAETGTAIPESVISFRASVRTKSNEIEALITACETLEQFIALYETPLDENNEPTGNPPIIDWPEES